MYHNSQPRCPRIRVGGSLTLLLAILVGAISGCTSSVNFRAASGAEEFPPFEGEVRILENLPPSGVYERVGVVMVEGVLLTKDANMVAAVKQKAAENGANAVVMQSPIRNTKQSDGSTTRKLAAWAIRLRK